MDLYLRLYYAMVTQLDDQIGRIVVHLKSAGLYDNTIIVFTSDHGDMQGSHGLTNKSRLYEESTRIPCIIRDPRAKPSVIDTPIGCVDFFATLIDWAAVQPGPGLPTRPEGKSLAPWIHSGRADNPRPVFMEDIGKPIIGLRMNQYKLLAHRHSRTPLEFFNLETDPYEMRNLLKEPSCAVPLRQTWETLFSIFEDLRSRANPVGRFPTFALAPV